jgi:inner membrane protein
VVSQKNGSTYFNDLRFGQLSVDPDNKDYVFSFLLEPQGDDIVVSENEKRPEDAGKMLGGLWERIWGT